jgi:hypothetical protein
MQFLKLNEGTANRRRIPFIAVDSTALQTRLSATDLGIGGAGAFTVWIHKTGGATGASAGGVAPSVGTITEVDSARKKGEFYLELAAADLDTAGPLTVTITCTGGAKTMEPREIVVMVTPLNLFDAAALGMTNLDAQVSTRALESDLTTALADLVALATALTTANAGVADIQARIPAALVGGFLKARVMAMDNDTLTAAALAADAVTEIQTGLATAAGVAALPSAAAIATAVLTFVNDVNAPANAKTVQQILNIIVSGHASPGSVPAPDQAIDLKNTAGTKSRVTGHITGGARVIDALDGTP